MTELRCQTGDFSPEKALAFQTINVFLDTMNLDFDVSEIQSLNLEFTEDGAFALRNEAGACVSSNGTPLNTFEVRFELL